MTAPVARLRLYLLVAVLALAAVPYLTSGAPGPFVALALLVPLLVALWSPPAGVALLLGAAPFTEAIAGYIIAGSPLARIPGGIVWIEPMFLGVAAGIVTRLSLRRDPPRASMPGSRFFAAVVVCNLAVQTLGYASQWQTMWPYPLRLFWSSLPDPSQLAPEHTLRAAFLFLAAPLWLWLVRNAIDGSEDRRVILLAWLCGALVVIGAGIAMWCYGVGFADNRFMALLDDSNSYASYLILSLFVGWAVRAAGPGLLGPGLLLRILASLLVASSALAIVMTGSKVGVLAGALSATAAAVSIIAKGRWWRVVVATTLIALVAAGVFSQRKQFSGVLREVSEPRYLRLYLLNNRLPVWSAATRASLAHPIAGIGPGLLCQNLGAYYRPGDRGWLPPVENAHDYFLQIAAEIGILGLLGFVVMTGASLRPALADRGAQARVQRLLAIGALGYLATLVTGHALLLSRQIILFWGLVGVIAAPYGGAAPSRVGRYAAWLLIPVFLATSWFDPIPRTCRPGLEKPATVAWNFDLGFHPAESDGSWRWMRDAGELFACNHSDRPLIADVTFNVESFDEARELAVYSRGQRLSAVSVPPNMTAISIRGVPLATGSTPLLFVASPGARSIDASVHNGDRRAVSVLFVGEPLISVTDASADGAPLR